MQGNRSLQQHPLENPLILQEIFKYCASTLCAVKTVRLVNKMWRDVSLIQWRSYTESQVIVAQDENISNKKATKLSNLIEKRKNVNCSEAKVPKRNITFYSWENVPLVPVAELQNMMLTKPQKSHILNLQKEFLTLYAPFLKFLTLSKCKFYGIFPVVLQQLVRNIPNIVRLRVLDCCFDAKSKTLDSLMHEFYTPGVVDLLLEKGKASLLQEVVNDKARVTLNLQKHHKLKFLFIRNLRDGDRNLENFSWTPLMLMFPNLEKITVQRQVESDDDSSQLYVLLSIIHKSGVYRKLKSLDLMRNSTLAVSKRRYLTEMKRLLNLGLILLESLTYSIGFESEWEDAKCILETQATTLKKLYLYRAPFNKFFYRFPCELAMLQLTELHLWGNVSGNLDFLGLMPSLQILKWNGSCFENNYLREKFDAHKRTETSVFSPLLNAQMVQNTSGLGIDFALEEMRCLEIDWEPLTAECWRKLGTWMPNLTKLKVMVKGNESLSMIGKLWPNIEDVELAHGSNVSAKGILEALTCVTCFQKLKNFHWKYCACMRKSNLEEEAEERLRVANVLSEMFGENTSNPWTVKGKIEPVCRQERFENTLILKVP